MTDVAENLVAAFEAGDAAAMADCMAFPFTVAYSDATSVTFDSLAEASAASSAMADLVPKVLSGFSSTAPLPPRRIESAEGGRSSSKASP